MNPNRNQLMKKIYETGFALNDTTLYLDTHPCDKEALKYYSMMQKAYKQAHWEYTSLYGPLRAEDVKAEKYWTWGESPWPWEVGAC